MNADAPLAAAFPRIAALVAGEAVVPDAPHTTADEVAARFGLDAFGRDVLLLAAWAELEPDGASSVAAVQGSPEPSVALALSRLPEASWAAFLPEAPLRGAGLIRLSGTGRPTGRSIALTESVLHALLGAEGLSEELALLARRIPPGRAETPTRAALREGIVAALLVGAAVQLCGPDPPGKLAAAARAASQLRRPLFAMPGGAVFTPPAEMAALARAWRRDLALTGGVLLVEAESGDPRNLAAFAEAMSGPLILTAAEPVSLPSRRAIRLDMGRPRAADQLLAWRAALAPFATRLNGTLPRIAQQFPLAPERMAAVAAELAAVEGEAALDEVAWAACRRHARPRMDDLAERVEGGAGWDDIVLPPAQMRTLHAIAAHLRHRAQVQEDWGFGTTPGGRGLGLAALFSGPSGAGKTMAAEVLGGALGLDVYRVDLSAMVSKWIGETEKNLRRVFDAAEDGSAILLFDEADALFGRRSEVRDSHDRYANMEISYLLQRLEAYRGLAILTTNLRGNVDDAFIRRFRFVVDFPFPAAAERAEIWARAFPRSCPTEGLDIARLAQLNVVGGAIRNIAMNAAYIAAESARPVSMREVLAAARLEYGKAGRAMTDPELRGWPS
jgi:hypothetical protein